MGARNRRLAAVAALTAGIALIAGSWNARAQLPPINLPLGPQQEPTQVTLIPEPTTSTTPPPPTADTTAPPSSDTTAPSEPPSSDTSAPDGSTSTTEAPSTTAGEGDTPPAEGDGDGAAGGVIPASAQRAIRAIARTAPNDNDALVEGVAALEATGVAHDEATRLVFGSFPILGPSHWSDDWYMPRWTGPTFRHHLGLDMMAPYGTPVAAPVDGVARISNSALGGLAVRVVESDGTFWYLAHLSGLVDGLVDGTPVSVGQVVGFVGDSGNARGGAPHLHFAVHPRGGAAVPPKPIVDRWVADGAARVPALLAADGVAPRSAAVVATAATRDLAAATNPAEGSAPVGPARSELLWATAANPAGGGVRLAEAAAAAVNETVDWERRAAQGRAMDAAWSRATATATATLGPLTVSALRQALDARRASSPPAVLSLGNS